MRRTLAGFFTHSMWSRPMRRLFRILLGIFFIAGGLAHFAQPETYLQMMPSILPAPLALIYVSGVFEILGGVGVLIQRTRRWAGIGLVALLVAVFPANVYMAVEQIAIPGLPSSPAALWGRLPIQIVFIAWVVWCTREDTAG